MGGSRVPGRERRRRGRNKRRGDRARRRVKIRRGAPVVTVQVTAAHSGVQASRLRGLPQVKRGRRTKPSPTSTRQDQATRKCPYIAQAPPRYLGEPTGKGWRQQDNLRFQVRFQQARPLWQIKVSSRLACNLRLPKKNTRRRNTSIRRKKRKRKRKRSKKTNGRRKMEAKPGVRRCA